MLRTTRRTFSLGVAALAVLLFACGDEELSNNETPTNQVNQNQGENQSPDNSGEHENNQTVTENSSDPNGTNANQEPDNSTEEPTPWDALPPRPWDSSAHGPFQVSYRYDSLSYLPRGDGEEERELKLSIWYPTFDEEGFMAFYNGLLNRPGIFEDAEPALREPAPVMVFSHGNGGISTQSYFWTEYLASHGWIVISPDHTNNTAFDNEGSINFRSAVYRPQDLTASLDYMLELPDEDPLAGYLSDKIAVSGHSFGGFTTLAISGATFPVDQLLAACDDGQISQGMCEIFTDSHMEVFREGFLDPRIQVAIPHTPGGADVMGEGLVDIEIPVLMWTAERDATLPNEEEGDRLWAGLAGEHDVRVDVIDTGHFTFSNMCTLVGDAVPQVANDGCGADFMDTELFFPLVNQYSMEFLRLHLKGDADAGAWFDPGHEPLHENLVFSFK